mgnify:CR=1 FL=1
MKKSRIYLDTSVIGGCFDKEFEEYSNILINEMISGNKIGVISDITLKELEQAPEQVKTFFKAIIGKLEILKMNFDITELANIYINESVISKNYFDDALHIAFATVYQLDMLVSWNFKHIVNYNRIRMINAVNIKSGYKTLDIYSPMEAIDEK